ncbi:MAG: Uma2 family endonuclease [Cyanobacteria bacterium P01_C01_bin.69]
MVQQLTNIEPANTESADIEAQAESTFDTIDELDISHLTIEDDTPVDNFQSAQQQRLLVDALCSNDILPLPFIAEANVGLFYKLKGDPPIVPDMLLSLGVQRAEDLSEKRDRAYFLWEFGKMPEVCLEIVSNKEGDEVALSAKSKRKGKVRSKKDLYAQIAIPYYAVYDPLRQIQDENNMNGALLRVWRLAAGKYVELTPASGITAPGQAAQLDTIGVGLTLWEGQYEEKVTRQWLRWCDRQGQVLPTGAEGKAIERQRADDEQKRADRLAAKLRELGVEPGDL